MTDYTWPSVYFAYLFFALSFALALFFFIRSCRDGYWGAKAEDVKYQVFQESADSGVLVGQACGRPPGRPPADRDVDVPRRRRRLPHKDSTGAN